MVLPKKDTEKERIEKRESLVARLRTLRERVRRIEADIDDLILQVQESDPDYLSTEMRHFITLLMWETVRVEPGAQTSASELFAAVRYVWESSPRLANIGKHAGFSPAPANRGYGAFRRAVAAQADRVVNRSGRLIYQGIALAVNRLDLIEYETDDDLKADADAAKVKPPYQSILFTREELSGTDKTEGGEP